MWVMGGGGNDASSVGYFWEGLFLSFTLLPLLGVYQCRPFSDCQLAEGCIVLGGLDKTHTQAHTHISHLKRSPVTRHCTLLIPWWVFPTKTQIWSLLRLFNPDIWRCCSLSHLSASDFSFTSFVLVWRFDQIIDPFVFYTWKFGNDVIFNTFQSQYNGSKLTHEALEWFFKHNVNLKLRINALLSSFLFR